MNNAEQLHSRLQIVLNALHYFARLSRSLASEALLESSEDRKALKSKVEVTFGLATSPTKLFIKLLL